MPKVPRNPGEPRRGVGGGCATDLDPRSDGAGRGRLRRELGQAGCVPADEDEHGRVGRADDLALRQSGMEASLAVGAAAGGGMTTDETSTGGTTTDKGGYGY